MEAGHAENNGMTPSLYGFRSIRARTRNERYALKDKVALEKSRLNQRSGWQARLHQMNAPEHTSGLTSCRENDAGYLSNSDRFHSDVAGEELEVRIHEMDKRHRALDYKKNQQLTREEERWKKMEEYSKQDDEYWQKVRDEGIKAKKNQSKVAYDITTLIYNNNVSGEDQKYVDDMVRYRAQARTRNLVILGDSRAPYNIISGGERYLPPAPVAVAKPLGPRTDAEKALVDYRKAI
jgi:hypothetical protein